MLNLNLTHRDLTVERMLVRGGFSRDTFLAVNEVIKARTGALRDKADGQKARGAMADKVFRPS